MGEEKVLEKDPTESKLNHFRELMKKRNQEIVVQKNLIKNLTIELDRLKDIELATLKMELLRKTKRLSKKWNEMDDKTSKYIVQYLGEILQRHDLTDNNKIHRVVAVTEFLQWVLEQRF